MHSMRPGAFLAAIGVLAIVAAACGGAAPGRATPGGEGGTAEEGITVDGARRRWARRQVVQRRGQRRPPVGHPGRARGRGGHLSSLEANQTGSNRDENITTLADQGFDIIIGVGFAFSEHVAEIAPDYPEVSFAIVDGFATFVNEDATNIADLTFKEQEGSFLGSGRRYEDRDPDGRVPGGQQGTGLIERFQAGYEGRGGRDLPGLRGPGGVHR